MHAGAKTRYLHWADGLQHSVRALLPAAEARHDGRVRLERLFDLKIEMDDVDDIQGSSSQSLSKESALDGAGGGRQP